MSQDTDELTENHVLEGQCPEKREITVKTGIFSRVEARGPGLPGMIGIGVVRGHR